MKKLLFLVLIWHINTRSMERIWHGIDQMTAQEIEDGARQREQINTRLKEACRTNNFQEAQTALKAGANPNKLKHIENPLFHYVVNSCPDEFVALFLKYHANQNIKDKNGNTALHFQLSLNKLQMLIDAKADINIQNCNGATPLMLAALHSDLGTAHILVHAGAHLDMQDNEGDTALHYAIRGEDQEMCKLLLNAGANIYLRNLWGQYSKKLDTSKEIIRLLWQKDRTSKKQFQLLDTIDSLNASLLQAVRKKDLEKARVCLAFGADIDARSKASNGETPLIIAAQQRNEPLCHMLLDSGANVNCMTPRGETALWIASEKPDVCPLMQLLVNTGADIYHAKNKVSVLHNCASRHDEQACRLILARQAAIQKGIIIGLCWMKKYALPIYQARNHLFVPLLEEYYQEHSLQRLLNAYTDDGRVPYDLVDPSWEWLKPKSHISINTLMNTSTAHLECPIDIDDLFG